MDVQDVVKIIRDNIGGFTLPLVDQVMVEFGHDPYLILISCLLSLRAKDSTTIHICRELFTRARTPQQMLAIERAELEQIIFRAVYYKVKAAVLHHVSRELIIRFGGKVPATLPELLSLKGVGLKTANLVLGLAYGVPSVCVDTHVHRISNRVGVVRTKTPEETESAIRRILPRELWIEYNKLLVMWGQNICVPISPKCSRCPLNKLCPKIGVTTRR